MECMTVELLPEFKHRYKIGAELYDRLNNRFSKINLFLDLGCYNTLIPKRLAVLSGQPLGFKRVYKIGGTIIEAEAYVIEKIMIKDFALERIVAFAADYTGEFASDILIGTNVMNNWKMTFDRKANIFQFSENPLDDLPNKKHIYQNFFDTTGNYKYVQDSEIES